MPLSIERARDVLAVAWSEGTTYWIQAERGVGGSVEVLHRSAGDLDEVIDRGAPRVGEPGTFYIVPGTDGVAWGHTGTREACGRVRIATRDGARAVDGELPCQFRVVAQRAGRLLVAPVGGRGMSSIDAATGQYAQFPGVDAGGEVERFAQRGDVVYALVTEIGGQYLGRFAAVDPSAVAPLATGSATGSARSSTMTARCGGSITSSTACRGRTRGASTGCPASPRCRSRSSTSRRTTSRGRAARCGFARPTRWCGSRRAIR